MYQIPENINAIVKEFVTEAKQDNVHISKAILFGSYAKGMNKEYRDIDLAVVSDDFVGIRIIDNK